MAKKKEKKMDSIESAINDISTVNVKKYLPIDIKIALVDEIVEAAGNIEDGIYIVNDFAVDIFMKLKFVANYTNIEMIDIDISKTYDLICESGFIETLFSTNEALKKEYDFIEDMVYAKLEQENIRNNSVAAILTKGLNLLLDKIPSGDDLDSVLKKVQDGVASLDPEKMTFIKSAMDNFAH